MDIIKLVQSYGFEVEKKGSNYFCLCPFHNDKNPSLALYPETKSFFCFSCNTGGPIERFIAKVENIPIREAYKKLYGNNYEFNALANDIDEITPDNKYMLDRLAIKIKSNARADKEFLKKVPNLITNILFSEMNLLKFNDLINKLNGEQYGVKSTKNV